MISSEVFDKGLVAIDTSAILPSKGLVRVLKKGWRGVRTFHGKDLRELSERVGRISSLIQSENVVVIREVVKELKFGLEFINRGLKGLRNHPDKDKVKRELDFRKLVAFGSYADRLYRFFKELERKNQGVRFPDKRAFSYNSINAVIKTDRGHMENYLYETSKYFFRKIHAERRNLFEIQPKDYKGKFMISPEKYISYLRLALKHSLDIRRKNIEGARCADKQGIGILLNTDCKLIASSFALSYQAPVTLLSRDKGIGTIVGRLQKNLRVPRVQEVYGISRSPKHVVTIYNPDKDPNPDKLSLIESMVLKG